MASCVSPKTVPASRVGSQMPAMTPEPPRAYMKKTGITITSGVQIAPTSALSWESESPVVAASVTTGMPIEPNATGTVFASKQIADALKGENPRPTSMVAAIATGVPNPAAPSRKPPKAKAISRACTRGSGVTRAMELRMTSNCPASTVTRNSAIAQKMIQVMGKRPNAAPSPAALIAVRTGMW
jgi:hypothetical protein